MTTNLEDPVGRGAVVTHGGETLWPDPNPPQLDAVKAAPKEEKEVKKEGPKDMFNETLKNACYMGAALASIVGLGIAVPDPAFMTMFSTFSLAVIAGY